MAPRSYPRREGNPWLGMSQYQTPTRESHINDTTTSPGLAANQAVQQKMSKYSKLLSVSTHIFCPVAIEIAQAHGTAWTSNSFRRLADALQPSLKMIGKQCFCSRPCNRGTRSPSKTVLTE